MFEGHVGIDLHAGFLRDNRILGEGGNSQVVVERVTVLIEPPLAAEQGAGAV